MTPTSQTTGKTVAFRTIGCKLNQCETAQMEERLRAAGFEVVPWDQPAELRIVNSCTVTAKTDRTCRHEIRKAKRLDPTCKLAVTGCYAQVSPQALSALPEVDLVLGNPEKAEIATRADRLLGYPEGAAREISDGTAAQDPENEFISHFTGYTRAFLKVQTGCDAHCAYCVIPTARGASRSMPAEHVMRQVDILTGAGYREVVLTGVNLGAWGLDSGEGRLADLIGGLLAHTQVPRLRLSSVEPLEVERRLLETIAEAGPRVAHHFHMPLQSGSDPVLARMKRPYRSEEYARVVRSVGDTFKDAAIGTDIIVGFPGETDDEFEQTCQLVNELPLTYLHVFSYSDRPGTAATRLTPKVHPDTVHHRSLVLRSLGQTKCAEFHERFRDHEISALVLRERVDDGRLVALTGNYIEAVFEGPDRLMNRFVNVSLKRPGAGGRWDADLLGTGPDDGPVIRACPIRAGCGGT